MKKKVLVRNELFSWRKIFNFKGCALQKCRCRTIFTKGDNEVLLCTHVVRKHYFFENLFFQEDFEKNENELIWVVDVHNYHITPEGPCGRDDE
jgi:hypothetical protein